MTEKEFLGKLSELLERQFKHFEKGEYYQYQ